MAKPNWLWTVVIAFLVIIIVTGGIVIVSRHQSEQPIEISFPQPQPQNVQVNISGAVNSPGLYALKQGDSIDSLIRAAGGTNSNASMAGLELYVPGSGLEPGVQRININRAETWLLEALPGIGPALAQRIVDYRTNNGPFQNTAQLLKVPGIATTTYEKFKDMITVADR